MSKLGEYLKQLRKEKDRPRRWVERQSKIIYPNDKRMYVSHCYLRQIEEGIQDKPSAIKLKTLAEIYKADYNELMRLAGYSIEEPAKDIKETAFNTTESQLETTVDVASKRLENIALNLNTFHKYIAETRNDEFIYSIFNLLRKYLENEQQLSINKKQ